MLFKTKFTPFPGGVRWNQTQSSHNPLPHCIMVIFWGGFFALLSQSPETIVSLCACVCSLFYSPSVIFASLSQIFEEEQKSLSDTMTSKFTPPSRSTLSGSLCLNEVRKKQDEFWHESVCDLHLSFMAKVHRLLLFRAH